MTLVSPPTVTDARVPAKGLLPSRTLVYLMVGLALLLTGVSVMTNLQAKKTPRSASAEPREPVDDPKRLTTFRTQLDTDAERARAMALAAPPKAVPDPQKTSTRTPSGADVEDRAPTTDAAAARVPRDHDSLFATTMVVSRRPVTEATADARPASTEPPPSTSLDDTVAAVLKQSRGLTLAPTAPVSATVPPTEKPAGPIRTPPLSGAGPLHTLLEGTVLDATLLHRLDGSNSAPVKAVIAGPVFSHDRHWVLIPDGTTALGLARAVQNYGDTRLAVSFHRLAFPDGSTVSLELDPGLDQAGDLGLHDKVNNHYLATFGRAAAVGVIVGLGQAVGYRSVSGGSGTDRSVIIAGEVGQSTTTAVTSLLNKMPLPTIEITEGHRLKIYLTHDLELPAWSRTGAVRPIR